MRSLSLSAALLVILMAISVATRSARAEEAEAPAAEAAKPLPKDQREFNEKTSRLNSLATRVEEAEKQFQELVARKASEKNPEEKQHIIKEMVATTEERNKSALEYNKIKSELALRYPNQGEHLNRNYKTQSKKSVEEMEGAAGLDELLSRTKKIIEKKFAPFNPEDKEVKKATAEVPVEDEKAKPLRLEK